MNVKKPRPFPGRGFFVDWSTSLQNNIHHRRFLPENTPVCGSPARAESVLEHHLPHDLPRRLADFRDVGLLDDGQALVQVQRVLVDDVDGAEFARAHLKNPE